MKKIIALALAAAGAIWAIRKSKETGPPDVWAKASDKV